MSSEHTVLKIENCLPHDLSNDVDNFHSKNSESGDSNEKEPYPIEI